MIKVSFENEGGELDSRTVNTEEQARAALIEMIEAVPYLNVGDRVVLTEFAPVKTVIFGKDHIEADRQKRLVSR